ncbi:hypothetical protein OG756_40505 [Streptomyces sp. NBC_01310]|uniref:hypothetical protein n=1 Tax=Streptomyces sp. NBC_01310 TaxID=2903820 RepID=UPI0035B66D75|nr:hypothetical protein OG756_00890 [Streptomyces sp. NBC_01310]WSJ63706.1 hypothetical protein OG756_40505 [Streptomyces sp. NBC_01310]
MDALRLLSEGDERVRLGALAVLEELCRADPSLTPGAVAVVRTAMVVWEEAGSRTGRLDAAAERLLASPR